MTTETTPIITEPKKCGCGQTKDVSGNCDGSHKNLTTSK